MPNCGVMPNVRPTVATAEAVSYKQTDIGSCSAVAMTKAPRKNSVKYIPAMVAAFLTAEPSMRRPKNSASSLRRKVAHILASRTANVVVFMPPAVEPGEPPNSIRTTINACEVLPIAARSAVLKPAVRGVTDWNIDNKMRCRAEPAVNSKQ